MVVPHRAHVCSKYSILVPLCLIGLLVNFLLFNRYSSSMDGPRTKVALSETSDFQSSASSGFVPQELISYMKKHKSEKDYNENKIVSNIRSILHILAESSSTSLLVLKELIINFHNKQDVIRFLSAQDANSTGQKSGVGSWAMIKNTVEAAKPKCPDEPPDLFGPITSNLASIVLRGLEKNYASLQGGHYAPEECTAAEKLAIIIPFRNRHSHLHMLLNNLLPVLIRQQLDFRIFVIEQAMPTTFNRAMLFNIGYLEALRVDNYDCFIFHDVDMIPLNDKCLYRCAPHPRHLSSAISKWKYGLPYKSFFGGVVAFTREQFRNINGCSNLYFGWGGEDDDLWKRVLKYGYKLLRYPKDIGRYDTIAHMPDIGNNPNPDRLKLIGSSRDRQGTEGLNTTKFNITRVEFKTLYTWIHVDINMAEVLEGHIFKKSGHIKRQAG